MATFLMYRGSVTQLAHAVVTRFGSDRKRIRDFANFANEHVVICDNSAEDAASGPPSGTFDHADWFDEDWYDGILRTAQRKTATANLEGCAALDEQAISIWERQAFLDLYRCHIVAGGPPTTRILRPAFHLHSRVEVYDPYLGKFNKDGTCNTDARDALHSLLMLCWEGGVTELSLHVATMQRGAHGHDADERWTGVRWYFDNVADDLRTQQRRPLEIYTHVYRHQHDKDFHDRSIIFSTGSAMGCATAFVLGRGIASLVMPNARITVARVSPEEAETVANVERALSRRVTVHPGEVRLHDCG
jgi:hypothetical protein